MRQDPPPPSAPSRLRILSLEDEPRDAELIQAALREAGLAFDFHRVATEPEFVAALESSQFDLVLADYTLPETDGITALRLCHARRPEWPFIFVSGSLGEEVAIETLKEGAADYVLKDRLDRLPRAIERAVREARERAARRAAEKALRVSEEKYRQISRCVPDLIWMMDLTGRYTYANSAVRRTYGWTVEEWLNLTFRDTGRPDQIAKNEILLAEELARATAPQPDRNRILTFETEELRKDGSTFWAEVTATFLWSDDNQPTGVIGTTRDVTERKRMEEALSRSEATLRSVFRTAPIGICIMKDRVYASANAFWCEKFGYPEEAILGQTTRMLYESDEEYDRVGQALYGELREHGLASVETKLRRSDGVFRDAILTAAPLHPEDLAAGTVVLIHDVTERKRAEQENALLAQTLKSAQDCISVTDLQNRIVFVNQAFLDTYGYAESELLGQDVRMLRSAPPAPALAQDEVFLSTLHGEWHGEVMNRRKDGTDFPIELWTSLVKDKSGAPTAMVGVARDITERKRAEEERQNLQTQLIQAQKMEAIGQLAGGVAHDFNNILAAMMMNFGLLRENPNLDQETQEVLGELEGATQRGAGLTRQLLMFSRRSVLDIKVLDLNELVANLLRMLGRLIGEDVDLQFQRKTALPAVEADEGMLEQVLMNLCVNARDAMPHGGQISLSTEAIQISKEDTAAHPNRRPGSFVCLSVSDTGCGMDAATLLRVFEPFFTTKEVGKGTGLGLATVHGIVAQHQGWVEVESQPGSGTTFRIFLPASDKSAALAAENVKQTLAKGHETILMVEDDPTVRRFIVQSLRVLSYRVLEAGHAPEALSLWQEHQQEIDLLLSDMVMPGGMSGLELAERLRAEKPELRVILSSGYSSVMAQFPNMSAAGIVFLQKPYPLSLLAQKVRECLDRK